MGVIAPEKKALIVAFIDANPTAENELQHLRDMAERGRAAAADAQKALAKAWTREREAELEVKRAKAARVRLQGRVRFAESQRQQLCEELDRAEWLAEAERLQEDAERAAVTCAAPAAAVASKHATMTHEQMQAEIQRQIAVLAGQQGQQATNGLAA